MTLGVVVVLETAIIAVMLVKKVWHWVSKEIRHMCRESRLKGRKEGNITW